MEADGCSSTYSEDNFELSFSGSSSVFGIADETRLDARESHEGGQQHQQQQRVENHKHEHFVEAAGERDSGCDEPKLVVSNQRDAADDDEDHADGSEAGYSSFGAPSESFEEEPSLPIMSPLFKTRERDGRSTKQKYLDLKRKAAAVWEEADALAQERYEDEVRLRLQAQQTKESWHERIHRRQTDLEWHRKVSGKTSQSIIEMAVNREAWTKGVLCARAKDIAMEEAFSSAFGSLQARTSEQNAAATAAVRKEAEERAAACSTVWDAARNSVPVRRLRELMDEKIRESRNFDPSEPFEQLCRRVEGIVLESRHPYPKGVRQDIEAEVPGADCFYVAFDAASNTTMGGGKVAMQELNARTPVAIFPRGPYNDDTSGEARLPGVNGEPPMRVEGSSMLVTFSASYWTGIAPAGEDYGWRLVCFAADSSDHAKASVTEAYRAADRAEAVDAVNFHGETCLHVASFEGNVPAARYLLSVDADPNSAHSASGHNTPLHEAARGGSLAVTRLLLKSSANVLAANSHGDLPLHVACRAGRLDIARRLLAHDPDWTTVTTRNHAGLQPSEVVLGCSALASLLVQVEATAATSCMINGAVAAPAGAIGAVAASTPALMQRGPSSSQQKNNKTGATAPGHVMGAGRFGGGGARGGTHSRRQGNGRARVRRTTGPRAGSLSEGTAGKAILSGSILPRWARLARPLDGVPHRQRQRRGVERASAGDGNNNNNNNVDSIASEDSNLDGQSVAGWSGTSYGASLAESDFGIPSSAAA